MNCQAAVAWCFTSSELKRFRASGEYRVAAADSFPAPQKNTPESDHDKHDDVWAVVGRIAHPTIVAGDDLFLTLLFHTVVWTQDVPAALGTDPCGVCQGIYMHGRPPALVDGLLGVGPGVAGRHNRPLQLGMVLPLGRVRQDLEPGFADRGDIPLELCTHAGWIAADGDARNALA